MEPPANDQTLARQTARVATRIGANLRRLRLKARDEEKRTQRGLAGAVGCEVNYIQKTEYGTAVPSLRFLVRLATALEVDVAEFFKRTAVARSKVKGRPPLKKAKSSRRG